MLRVLGAHDTVQHLFLQSQWQPDAQLRDRVATIIDQVRRQGDAALLGFTNKYDHHPAGSIDELRLGKEQLSQALKQLPHQQRQLLTTTLKRVEAFHRHQLEQGFMFTDTLGNRLGQRVAPLERAGLYAPGGQAVYPSSIIMNAAPARVAGVISLLLCSPAPQGRLNPLIPATAALCEVEELWCIGGAQAVAAMAFGTDSIARVDKIVGPGNAWVAEAKRQVYGLVGLDMLAGPSEIVIISDASANPHWLLADLCSQAEHDPQARAILLTTSRSEAEQVAELAAQLVPSWQRSEIIRQSLQANGAIVVCDDLDQACQLANNLAPEHLELMVQNPQALADKIHNAGAIFLGAHSCESLGDYCAGPNHVLPTAGSARFGSPLGVYDFVKRTSLIHCSAKGAASLAEIAAPLARLEGLHAHQLAASYRRQPQQP